MKPNNLVRDAHDFEHYVIRGGVEGRERLKLLSRVMHPGTCELFDRAGVVEGITCLDVGCGSGDVTMELVRLAGRRGKAVGADLDPTKIALAREEAKARGITNIEFRVADIRETAGAGEFDVVYARFLLTHLADPVQAVNTFFSY